MKTKKISSQKCFEEKYADLLLIREENKKHYVIILYIVEESFFVVTVYKLLAQKKYSNAILMIALKLMVNKWLRCLKTVNMLDSKILKGKWNHYLWYMQILKVF